MLSATFFAETSQRSCRSSREEREFLWARAREGTREIEGKVPLFSPRASLPSGTRLSNSRAILIQLLSCKLEQGEWVERNAYLLWLLSFRACTFKTQSYIRHTHILRTYLFLVTTFASHNMNNSFMVAVDTCMHC